MSVRISLTLETSETFLSLHMIFSLERAAVVWAILERISGFDPSLEMIAPKYLKFSTSSSLWPFYLDLFLEAIWFVCHHFCLVSQFRSDVYLFLFTLYVHLVYSVFQIALMFMSLSLQ